MIELEAGNSFAAGQSRGLGQFAQLSTVDKGLHYIPPGVVIVVDNCRYPGAEVGQVFDVLFGAIVVHVVGGGFGPQQPVVAHVLFGDAVTVMTADHRVGQIKTFNNRLQLAIIVCSLPLYSLVTSRPKIVVILFGCPMLRFRSSSRCVTSSTAAGDGR